MKKVKFTEEQKQEMRQTASLYQKANRTDPFAFKRALSHMLTGVYSSTEYLDMSKLGMRKEAASDVT